MMTLEELRTQRWRPPDVAALLKAGAGITVKDRDGGTAFMTAQRCEQAEVVQLSRDSGVTE
jgi:hypothetical protein